MRSVSSIVSILPIVPLVLAAGAMLAAPAAAQAGDEATATLVERGRYLARIAACNDCHTPNYAATEGKVPEAEWLTGDRLGWQGPWGTSYPANLRRFFARTSEADWLRIARERGFRPPMPGVILRDMSDDDLRALWHYVRALGPAGEEMPAWLPPGQEPSGPVVRFPMAGH